MAHDEGTPQSGPLSPLLANVLLDEADRAPQQRGRRFVRYADDCNVYGRSQKAGERVLGWMRKIYERLHLRVNEKKTEVGPVFGRKFLGYCLRRWSGNTVKAAAKSVARVVLRRQRAVASLARGRHGHRQITLARSSGLASLRPQPARVRAGANGRSRRLDSRARRSRPAASGE